MVEGEERKQLPCRSLYMLGTEGFAPRCHFPHQLPHTLPGPIIHFSQPKKKCLKAPHSGLVGERNSFFHRLTLNESYFHPHLSLVLPFLPGISESWASLGFEKEEALFPMP